MTGKKSLFVRTRERRAARLRRQRREELCDPIITYLMERQSEAETLDEQDHYKFCCRVVSMALDGWPEPFVAAFYYHYGRHPNKLIPEWLQRQEYAKTLGPSLAELLNNPIPDYDPTSELRIPPPQSGAMHQVSASGWPTEHDTVRNPQAEECTGEPRISRQGATRLARPDALDAQQKPVLAPFRRILDRIPTVQDGHLVYYTEQLECGHSHVEFLGGNPGKKRRCQSCPSSGPLCPVVSTAFLRSCSGLGRLHWRQDYGVSLWGKGNRRATLRSVPRPDKTCCQCGAAFTVARKDAQYCSSRCRNRAGKILRRLRWLETSKAGRCAR